MKCKPIVCLAVLVFVGALLAGWCLRGGGPSPGVVPPENQLASRKADEAARRARLEQERLEQERLEQERLAREEKAEECRQALRRTALAFLAEAAQSADAMRDPGRRAKTLRLIASMQTREGEFEAALATAALVGGGRRAGYSSSTFSGYSSIALAQARTGDFTAAVTTASATGATGNGPMLLQRIIRMQFAAGDRAGARNTLAVLIDIVEDSRQRSTGVIPFYSKLIAEMQLAVGDRDDAVATLRANLPAVLAIKIDSARGVFLYQLAKEQARTGDVAGVRETLGHVKSVGRDSEARHLAIIAKAQAEAGDIAGARTVAATSLAKTRYGPEIWRGIVEAQARAGDFAGAMDTAKMSGAAIKPDEARVVIARAQCQAGNLAAAMATSAEIMSWAERDTIQPEIADAQANRGDFAGAMATAATIRGAERRDPVYKSLAAAQAEAGAFAGARKAATAVKEERKRAEACLAVGQAQVAAEDHTGLDPLLEATTLLTASKVDTTMHFFATSQIAIVKLHVAVGDVPRATKLLRGFVDRLATLESKAPSGRKPSERVVLMFRRNRDSQRGYLGRVQAEIGDFAGALATAAVTKDARQRARILQEIAGRQAQKGDVAAARATAAKIEAPAQADMAYLRIAMAQAEARDKIGAQTTLEEIKDPRARQGADKAVAAVLGDGADLPNAAAPAAGNHSLVRAETSQKIAQTHGERGDAAKILEAARLEMDAYCRARILLCGARGLLAMTKSAAPALVPPSTTPLPVIPVPDTPTIALPPNRFPPPPPLPE